MPLETVVVKQGRPASRVSKTEPLSANGGMSGLLFRHAHDARINSAAFPQSQSWLMADLLYQQLVMLNLFLRWLPGLGT